MRAELKIVKGRQVGKSVAVGPDESVTLGRSVSADFQVHDQAVSRRHCTVSVTPAGCQLVDLGSANGTYVNGRRTNQCPLRAGDEVRLGSTLITILLESGFLVDIKFCSRCGRSLSQATFDGGEVYDDGGGQYLCPECKPTVDAPVIGDYRVTRMLGRGAMGTVYMGESISTGLRVALKALALDKTQNEKCVKRFLQEAKLAASLQHAGIVQVFDIIEAMGTYCLVMEFVDGCSVIEKLERQGRLEVADGASVARQIAAALQHAFEAKIIHRDIKPHNILVTDDGRAKLVDFGIAKSLEQSGLSRITAPGQHLGTLSYMSPEQLRNALSADQRSDIYSLGATLYHMLAGVPPVAGKDFEEVVIGILDRYPTPIRDVNPAVPESLAQVLEKTMRKDPDERYQFSSELERDLVALGF